MASGVWSHNFTLTELHFGLDVLNPAWWRKALIRVWHAWELVGNWTLYPRPGLVIKIRITKVRPLTYCSSQCPLIPVINATWMKCKLDLDNFIMEYIYTYIYCILAYKNSGQEVYLVSSFSTNPLNSILKTLFSLRWPQSRKSFAITFFFFFQQGLRP